MTSSARILLDSIGPNGARLTTFELTYPRFIHAELMTHRMFSRNSASSRAIPVEKLIARIEADPALPVWWGKNQSGMQAREALSGVDLEVAQRLWALLRTNTISAVRELLALGLHKQIANRPLETWMPITVLVTATHWSNARALRVSPEAQPEFDDVMRKAFAAYDKSEPRPLLSGEWHLPLVTGYDHPALLKEGYTDTRLRYVSTGRCAAVSYMNHDTGKLEPEKDEQRAMKLLESGHMSPFEHPAQAMTKEEWIHYGMKLAVDWVHEGIPVGNLHGWKQFRKIILHEHDFSLLERKT